MALTATLAPFRLMFFTGDHGMELLPWAHQTSAGFSLRGWHSPPSGKPLLHFLHGNGFSTRSYEPLLELLAHDFDLWLCDLQGHGQSDHGDKFVGWNRNAELALETADRIASRSLNEPGMNDESLVNLAFETVLTRGATQDELAESRKFLQEMRALLKQNAVADPEPRARARLVHVLLNHNDFITIR